MFQAQLYLSSFRVFFKFIWWKISPKSYRRRYSPTKKVYSIGIVRGDSPLYLNKSLDLSKPVITFDDITDIPATVVADPFMIKVEDYWYMFFEVKNSIRNLGEIGLAKSNDTINWKYEGIVLRKPHHLSYPYAFEYQGEYFMIPEASRSKAITLYKASKFPYQWKPIKNLLEGQRFADNSIFNFQNKWWLYTDAGKDSRNPLLKLYYSDTLLGTWKEHAKSPILKNSPHKSRPGGRVIIVDGKPIRFAQDIFPDYGKQVYAFQVTKLSTMDYEEKEFGTNPIVQNGDYYWNKDGMHHVDAHKSTDGSWIACVDGYWHQKRNSNSELIRILNRNKITNL